MGPSQVANSCAVAAVDSQLRDRKLARLQLKQCSAGWLFSLYVSCIPVSIGILFIEICFCDGRFGR
jgi:hypothetical protein